MKKQLLAILLMAISVVGFSQVKISQMPAYTGKPDQAMIPVVVNGYNYRITASQLTDSLALNKVDSVKVSNDSLFAYKQGARSFVVKLDYIKNQFAQQQSAKLWIDSVKAGNLPNTRFYTKTIDGVTYQSLYIGDSSGYYASPQNWTYAAYANTALGNKAMEHLIDGLQNTAVGSNAMENATSANWNTAIGQGALRALTTGTDNTAIGQVAGMYSQTATHNVFVGEFAGASTDGQQNVYVGKNSGSNNPSGSFNTYVGYATGYSNVGSSNVFLGYRAGQSEIGSNKLYIANLNNSTPLIYGEFDTKKVQFNGHTIVPSGYRALYNGVVDDGVTPVQVSGDVVFQGKISGGTKYVQYPAYRTSLDLASVAGWPAASINFPAGGAFTVSELGLVGSGDIFFQAIPKTVSGYGIIEGWQTAGLIIGTGGNTNPIIFRVNRTEVGRITATSFKFLQVLNLVASTAPTSSADVSGTEGDLRRDASGNLYLRTASSWVKFTGTTF